MRTLLVGFGHIWSNQIVVIEEESNPYESENDVYSWSKTERIL